jgi:hypothetical protein
MSNRRKSMIERTGQPGYGRKAQRPMFRFAQVFGRDQGPTGSRDRSLSGKARIRARRASNHEGDIA